MQNPITEDPRFKCALLLIQLGQEQAEHIKTQYELDSALVRIEELEKAAKPSE